MAVRKIPMRKCIACGTQRPKRELIRFVRTPEQEIFIDPKGKVSGRGAYLCADQHCYETAMKKKLLSRMLEIEISPETGERLQAEWGRILFEREREKRL
ncbi:MAG: YlxR family protein [Thermicanus sp.]|nr:YlxR family protein [Thermicanus sp.]